MQVLFIYLISWRASLLGFLCRSGWSSRCNGSLTNQNPSPLCNAILALSKSCKNRKHQDISRFQICFPQLFDSQYHLVMFRRLPLWSGQYHSVTSNISRALAMCILLHGLKPVHVANNGFCLLTWLNDVHTWDVIQAWNWASFRQDWTEMGWI